MLSDLNVKCDLSLYLAIVLDGVCASCELPYFLKKLFLKHGRNFTR